MYLHLTHPGSWEIMTSGQYAFWTYKHSELPNKAAKCKLCTEICKKIKPIIPASKGFPHISISEPNGEFQIDFGGPIKSEKEQDMVFDKTNGPNVVKFLDDFIQIDGVRQDIKLD